MKVIHFHDVCTMTTTIISIKLRKTQHQCGIYIIYGCANDDICNLSLRVQMMFTMHLENSEEHRKNKEERSHVKCNNIGNIWHRQSGLNAVALKQPLLRPIVQQDPALVALLRPVEYNFAVELCNSICGHRDRNLASRACPVVVLPSLSGVSRARRCEP